MALMTSKMTRHVGPVMSSAVPDLCGIATVIRFTSLIHHDPTGGQEQPIVTLITNPRDVLA